MYISIIVYLQYKQLQQRRYKKNKIEKMPKKVTKNQIAQHSQQMDNHDENQHQHETTTTALTNHNSNVQSNNNNGKQCSKDDTEGNEESQEKRKKFNKRGKGNVRVNTGYSEEDNGDDKENCNDGVMVDRNDGKKRDNQPIKCKQKNEKLNGPKNSRSLQQQNGSQQQEQKQPQPQQQQLPKPTPKKQKLSKKQQNLALQQQHLQARKLKNTKLPKLAVSISYSKADPIRQDNKDDDDGDGFYNSGVQFIKEVQKWQNKCNMDDLRNNANQDIIDKYQTKKVQKIEKQANKVKIQRKCYITKFFNQFYNFIVNPKLKPSSQSTQTTDLAKASKPTQVSTLKSVLFYILLPIILIPFLALYTAYILLYFIAIWLLLMPASAAGIQTVRMYFNCKRQKQMYFSFISALIIKFSIVIFIVLWLCRIVRLFRRQAFIYDMKLVLSGEMSHILRGKPLNGGDKGTQEEYELQEDGNKCDCVCICQNCELCTQAKKNYGQRCFPLHSKRILCIYFPESVENIFLRKLTEREEAAKQKQKQKENQPSSMINDKKVGKVIQKIAAQKQKLKKIQKSLKK